MVTSKYGPASCYCASLALRVVLGLLSQWQMGAMLADSEFFRGMLSYAEHRRFLVEWLRQARLPPGRNGSRASLLHSRKLNGVRVRSSRCLCTVSREVQRAFVLWLVLGLAYSCIRAGFLVDALQQGVAGPGPGGRERNQNVTRINDMSRCQPLRVKESRCIRMDE